jgi:hypothetical protein
MEIVARYRAVDGKEFGDETHCVQWEHWLEDLAEANRLLADGSSVWDALVRAHARCQFDWSAWKAQIRDTLSLLSHETKLRIPHWQGSYAAGYSPNGITTDGSVFVSGDAGSSWGSYGQKVGLRDLVRYARENGISSSRVTNPHDTLCTPVNVEQALTNARELPTHVSQSAYPWFEYRVLAAEVERLRAENVEWKERAWRVSCDLETERSRPCLPEVDDVPESAESRGIRCRVCGLFMPRPAADVCAYCTEKLGI